MGYLTSRLSTISLELALGLFGFLALGLGMGLGFALELGLRSQNATMLIWLCCIFYYFSSSYFATLELPFMDNKTVTELKIWIIYDLLKGPT